MTEVVDRPASRRIHHVWLIWAARLFLAVAFVFFGAVKFASTGMWVRLFDQIGFGQWFRYFTGVVEVVAGALMLVPRATLAAALLIGSAMIGALLTHAIVVGIGPQTAIVLVLSGLTVFVALASRE